MPSFAVGTEVTQRFHGFCEVGGKATRVWPEPDGQQMHHVQYDDGDSEDLNGSEVAGILKRKAPRRRPPPAAPDTPAPKKARGRATPQPCSGSAIAAPNTCRYLPRAPLLGMLGRRFHSIPGKGFCGYMALAHELQISAGAVFPLLRTCIVSEQGATDPDIRSSLQTITSAEGEWLAQAARGVPEDRRNCLDKPGMFFCSDWARPVAMWLGVPVLLVADTGDFDSHTCQVCTKEPYAYTHTADSTGRFHTTSYESTADARDAAVLAKRDGAVVLVFTTPTPHRLGHFDATSRLPAAGGGDGQQSGDGASTGTSACWDAKNKKYQARVLNSATGKWECHGRYGTEQAALAAAAAAAKGKKSPTAETLQCPCCGYDNALELKDDEAKRSGCKQTWKCVNPRCSKELRGAKLGKAGTVARCELCGKFETIKHAERHRCRGFHISHDLQLLIDSGDADAPAALSDHTADTDGWDDDFLPGYASGASDDGDLF